MKQDPIESVNVVSAKRSPPRQGPGSGKDAWVEFAIDQAKNGKVLWEIIDDQSAVIKALNAEVEALQKQIATRKPKGGRPKLDDKRIAEIERDLAAGYTMRQTATRCGVSAMTVSRIAGRVT